MAKKVNTNISLDPNLKKEAVELFASFGLDLSTAIGMFLSQSVREGKIPFEIRNVRKKVSTEEKDDNHKDDCEYYHNRNEVFFDRRNYRKIYNCPYKYCVLGELCPYKHPSDIKINEIYLPEKYREELRKKQQELIKLNYEISEKLKKMPKCIICRNVLGLKFVVC